MAFVLNVIYIEWLLWTVETMYFDVVEPVFISTVTKSSLSGPNQLGNSFNIFTLKCYRTTTVIHYPNWPKILYSAEFIIPF